MSFQTGRFRRADRILCSRDFGRAAKSGKRRSLRSFVVIVAPRAENTVGGFKEQRTRLGVTVGRRVGGSVVRNRVKRRIREWFRHAREYLPNGSDIVVIARHGAAQLSTGEVAATLDEAIRGTRSRRSDRTAAETR